MATPLLEKLTPLALAPLPTRPRVSVLVANYNYARYLGSAIESVLAQTYQEFELIVCDDGSTDDSRDVCSSYAMRDSRVRLVCKSNGGQASALNAAWRESRGDIICLLDSDDSFSTEKLAIVVEAFRSNPEAGFVTHSVMRVDAMGRQRGTLPLLGVPPSGWLAPMLVAKGGILGDLPPCSGLNVRREVARRIFPMPEHLGLYGDTPVMRLAPLITEVVGLEAPLAQWRQHGGNAFNQSRLTVSQIDRSLQMYGALWELQRAYLESIDARLAAEFCPLERDQHVLTLRYLRARLSGDSGATSRHRSLMESAMLRSEPRLRQWFWRGSIWLPRPIFRASVNLLVSQNVLKDAVARVRGLYRRRGTDVHGAPTRGVMK
jgi:glycosyltransferase involved in cell wall biosynthesis